MRDKDINEFVAGVSFDAALAKFVALLTVRDAEHTKTNFPSLTPATFNVEPGRKYVRVVRCSGGRSAYCFVEQSTGNIYKPAGWKTPTTKHVRGNIYNLDPLAGTNVYGTNYVR